MCPSSSGATDPRVFYRSIGDLEGLLEWVNAYIQMLTERSAELRRVEGSEGEAVWKILHGLNSGAAGCDLVWSATKPLVDEYRGRADPIPRQRLVGVYEAIATALADLLKERLDLQRNAPG